MSSAYRSIGSIVIVLLIIAHHHISAVSHPMTAQFSPPISNITEALYTYCEPICMDIHNSERDLHHYYNCNFYCKYYIQMSVECCMPDLDVVDVDGATDAHFKPLQRYTSCEALCSEHLKGRDSCLLGCQSIEALDPPIPRTHVQIAALIRANDSRTDGVYKSGANRTMLAVLMLSAFGLVLTTMRCLRGKSDHLKQEWSASELAGGESMLEKPPTYSVAAPDQYFYPAVAVRIEPVVVQSESDGEVTS